MPLLIGRWLPQRAQRDSPSSLVLSSAQVGQGFRLMNLYPLLRAILGVKSNHNFREISGCKKYLEFDDTFWVYKVSLIL
jgi:hypothetical protein